MELEECKEKDIMASQIISDLKKAGSDDMGSLIDMLKQYREREANCTDEIDKLKQLSVIKDDEIINLDIELKSLHDFFMNVQNNQIEKINSYKYQIEENRIIIKRQDKLIVDL